MIKTTFHNKSRRLRKKLHLGEFAQYGVDIILHLADADEQTDSAFFAQWDSWVQNQALCYTSSNVQGTLHITLFSDADRPGLTEVFTQCGLWLHTQPLVSQVKVGAPYDIYYDARPFSPAGAD
ncbi:50S ribosome-binding protein YggL [Bowmanella denitrificans]|uniref:50S ribosome-binding protein YggL n=1 Tax=Bowmanella denitrificans TaxID=366582 RepID=UPI000C9B137C|nr:50S ribosome-binding protein YggL [Bowmanella denitrificans]